MRYATGIIIATVIYYASMTFLQWDLTWIGHAGVWDVEQRSDALLGYVIFVAFPTSLTYLNRTRSE